MGLKHFTRRHAAALFAAAAVVAAPQAFAQAKVAMLLPGSINDQSWNAAGFGALTQLKAKGVDTAYSENVAPATQIETMKDYASRGFTTVIGHSGRFLSAAQRVGPEFEKTTFIVGSGASGFGKNVVAVDYDNAQMGYLMGVLAARMSKTGKIGSVNGLEGLPNVVQQVGGFRLGVKSVRPDAEVKVIYIKEMEDAAMAKEAALALIAGGADFVFGKLNAGQVGIIQAAREKNVYTSGRSMGHVEAAPQNVLTAIVEKWPAMYVAAVTDAGGRQAEARTDHVRLQLARRLGRGPGLRQRQVAEPGGAACDRRGTRDDQEEVRLGRDQGQRHARGRARRHLSTDPRVGKGSRSQ